MFWATIFLGLIIFVPTREGASPRGKFYLAGMALAAIAWGFGQIRTARRKQKKPDAAKERNDA